jgi:hypothetical protein
MDAVFRSTWSALHGRRSRLAVAVVAPGAGIGLGLPAVLPSAPAPPAAAEHGHTDPSAADYLAIAAAPVTAAAVPGPDASVGTFSADCGRNVDGHRNSDNFFVSPGVAGGAHHLHDYVGNTSTDRDSTDASLAAAGTTCTRGDRSTYYWPVLWVRGSTLTPTSVSITFRGNPQGPVAALPEFSRASVGNAKAVTDPDAPTGRVRWTCSGTPDRSTTTHYPLCPAGQLVQRVADYPSCWDGAPATGPGYREHVVFGDPDTGGCPAGTTAVPQLRITVGYRVPAGDSYAVDTFPDQLSKPVADHFDFEDVMPPDLMRQVVECINGGRTC